ncbi:MAG: TAXI family TRAP transporter solute-binding subunit, partial [Chloroflexota bacterium]
IKLQNGNFHWATSTTLEGAAMAYQGIARAEYIKAGPWPELRIPFLQSLLPIHFTVVADSGVEKLEDLDGKPFSAGIAGSGAEYFTRLTLDALGIKPKYFMANYTDAVQAAKEGRIVGFAKYASGLYLDASEIDLMSAKPIRILNWTDKQMQAAMATVPGVGAYRFAANEIKPLAPHPVINTPLSVIVEISTSKIPQDIGYKMWKTIIDNWDAIVEVYAPAAGVDPALTAIKELQNMAKVTKIPPLHAGTVQYLVEKGIAVPKELIPPEYKPVK